MEDFAGTLGTVFGENATTMSVVTRRGGAVVYETLVVAYPRVYTARVTSEFTWKEAGATGSVTRVEWPEAGQANAFVRKWSERMREQGRETRDGDVHRVQEALGALAEGRRATWKRYTESKAEGREGRARSSPVPIEAATSVESSRRVDEIGLRGADLADTNWMEWWPGDDEGLALAMEMVRGSGEAEEAVREKGVGASVVEHMDLREEQLVVEPVIWNDVDVDVDVDAWLEGGIGLPWTGAEGIVGVG